MDKYQQADNQKDIILKPSKKGHKFYMEQSRLILKAALKEPFGILDELSDDNLKIVIKYFSKMTSDLEPDNNKTRKLFKLQ